LFLGFIPEKGFNMIELILVRHGETNSNVKGTYLGWTDIGLNEKGIQQAFLAKEKLKGEKVDAIFCSPLKRARRTAEIINENLSLEINHCEGLKERNFGCWDDLTYQEITHKYPKEYECYTNDWVNYCIKGGESAKQSYERTTGFIKDLIGRSDNGTFIIVTHLGCIRNILAFLLELNIEGAWHFRVDNAGITRIQINDEKYAYLSLLNG
jgi:alpha-ribazole phosphatase